jgi:hypothetical protein
MKFLFLNSQSYLIAIKFCNRRDEDYKDDVRKGICVVDNEGKMQESEHFIPLVKNFIRSQKMWNE